MMSQFTRIQVLRQSHVEPSVPLVCIRRGQKDPQNR